MRALGRVILGLGLVLAVAAAGLYLLRAPVAGLVLRAALERAGVEHPRLEVEEISLRRLRLAEVSAGADPSAPDFSFATVEADFDWRTLLRARRVERIHIGPGYIAARVDENNRIEIAGLTFGGDGGNGAAGAGPPVDSVAVDGLDLTVASPKGNAAGRLSGLFDMEGGGAFSIHLDTKRYGQDAPAFENAALDAKLSLEADGGATAAGDFTGDLISAAGAVRGLDMMIEAQGGSWRAALVGDMNEFRGEASIDIRSAGLATSETPALSSLSASDNGAFPGGPVSLLSVTGGLRATIEAGRLAVFSDDAAPLTVVADSGAALTLESLPGAPLYTLDDARAKAAFGMTVSGGELAATARFIAETADDGVLRFDADAAIDRYDTGYASLGRTELVAKGTASAEAVEVDVALQSTVKHAVMGGFSISDAIIDAPFHMTTDLSARRAVLEVAADNCLRLDNARVMLGERKTAAALDTARLCPSEAPLIAVDWSGAIRADFAGILSATAAQYRLGETVLAGAPPRIDFTAVYAPGRGAEDGGAVLSFDEADALLGNRSEVKDAHDRYANDETGNLTVKGRLNGGRVVVNDALVLAGVTGAFKANLDGDGLTVESNLQSLRVSQAGAKKQVAPVMASGEASFVGDEARFSFVLATPEGALLGSGEGVHDLKTSKGSATFDSGLLVFTPEGLQPARLISPLYGLVHDMTGAGSAIARIEWGAKPDDFQSTAEISLDHGTFVGPGLAVSKTAGLSGTLKFSSLAPLTTDGVQTVSVELVDLDALRLENGEIIFELPGDETLRLHRGEFPWFGGEIGVYDATASLAGDKVTAPLRAVGVDLSQLLAYLNVKSLSGEGVVEGVLPLVIDNGKARIENGELSAVGPGIIRYTGEATRAAAASNQGTRIAFDILRELHFEKLTAKINGPLDGDIDFRIVFEGNNNITFDQRQRSVAAPIIYRISIEAPLLALINQARVTTDFRLQYEPLIRRRNSGQ